MDRFWLAAATLEISASMYSKETEPFKNHIYYYIFKLVSSLRVWIKGQDCSCFSACTWPTPTEWSSCV